MRNNPIGWVLVLILAASCVREEAHTEVLLVNGPDIRATQEGDPQTKTVLSTDEEGKGTVYWLPKERINVFFNQAGALYTSTNEKNATNTVFCTEDLIDYSDIQAKNVWGLYPYDSSAQSDGSSVTTTIPYMQQAVAETFDTDLFPLLAHSSNMDLTFYHVCGGFKFSLSRDDIYKIEFRGNGDEGLAGKVKLTLSSEGRPKADILEKEKSLVLTPKNGSTFKKDQDYYLICLPVSLSRGFEMTFYSITGKKATYKRESPITIKRAIFTRKAHIDKNVSFWEDNPDMTGGKRSGLYLGITGFNQQIYNYPISRLNEVSINDFYSFVNGLEMKNGTLLCYSVDQSINRLQDAIFPDDLCAVSLVTFTDGLDQGSVMMNPVFTSDEEYLNYIQSRIKREKVAGYPILAYSIGLMGSDVSDVEKFRSNLKKLASSSNNAFEVNSMSGVNSRLQEIATNVTDISYLYDIALRIPGQSDGTRIRFTFDDVNDAAYSSSYIEGVFHLNDYSLHDVTYNGLISESESVIKGIVDGIFVSFAFKKVKRADGAAIKQSAIKQWAYVTSTGKWQINSEFDASQNSEVEVTKQSVAVMFVLDCSSSLSSQYSTMQQYARSFINTLQQASHDPYAVSSVKLNTTSKSVTVGSSFQLTATVTPTTAKDKSVIWTSSDPAVATVDQEGLVTTLTPGTAVIVVTTNDGGYSASCSVEVKPIYVTKITLDKQTLSLRKGKSAVLQASFQPDNASFQTASWNSSNEEIATVDEEGTVTAVGVGKVTITATAIDGGGRYATCSVICWDAPDLVDLGLSVKWGTLNVGAYAPESVGDYFAWGETEPKTTFNWSNYKWSNNGSSSRFTKYNTYSSYGPVDNKTVLEGDDDAATVLLGGSWRMPTKEEFDELNNSNNCTWTWTTQNGVKGYKVTSKKTGFTDKSIFLPIGGYQSGSSVTNASSYGYFWTSTLYSESPALAWFFNLYSSNHGNSASERYMGYSIRPVSSFDVTAITLDPSKLELIVGESMALTPCFSPRQPLSYQLKWTSSDEKVATVTDGKVRALKTGSATITASLPDGSVKATCSVTVKAWTDSEVVDLGLSVKWATVNLGTSSPEGIGDYFAWGETEPKTTYNWSTYKWCNGSSSTLTKYNTSSSYGTVDNKTLLETEDDAAAVLLGGNWRMPTQQEFNELNNSNNCTWTWTTQNGVKGYKVTSKKTGFTDKSIFLPAGGYQNESTLNSASSYGYFWTSTLYSDSPSHAWGSYLNSSGHGGTTSNRYMGYSIRPVMAFSGTKLSIDPSETVLSVGNSITLKPVFSPRAPLSYTMKWSSSDEKVATVNSNGSVKGVSQGKVTITGTLEGTSLTASCTITVIQMVTSITLTPSSLSLQKGKSATLTATTGPENATDKSLTWSSDDASIARVDNSGTVTATGSGLVTIRATAKDGSGLYATCSVTCWDAPELVDLGLSVRWGCWNIGTYAPEGYGDYYAWGETSAKTSFNWSNYKWSSNGSSSNMTKYNTSSSYGAVDNKTVLEAEDDAATVLLGNTWRMPTKEEFDELNNNCTWSWTTQDGVKGYKVTSKITGFTDKSIFLPATGYREGTSLYNSSSYGYFWTSTLYSDTPSNARRVYMNSSNHSLGNSSRYYGYPIRPVSSFAVTAITLDSSKLELIVGESAVLTPIFSPRQPLSYQLKWTSSNEKVATVTDGKVRAIKTGSATITASLPDGSVKATCAVTVTTWTASEVVDLGLSVKWATINLGTSSPEGAGDYFAWGENEPKTAYSWSTYKWCNGSSSTLTKYNTSSSYGTVDNKSFLEAEDDAAAVLLGGKWRMPTQQEFDELRNTSNCTWTWTSQNGVNGYKVTSKKSGFTGNSIFLPVTGYRDGLNLNSSSSGYMWTSTLYSTPYSSWRFYYYTSDRYNSGSSRYQGSPIRPVEEIQLTTFTLDATEVTLNVGASRTLTLTTAPRIPASVIWTSSNTTVASVSNGTVKTLAPGKTTITVSTLGGSNKATCDVTVIRPVTDVTMNRSSLTLKEGEKQALAATLSPEDASDKTLTWTSTNESIVKVDKNGTVTAVQKGKASVWASANDGSGKYAECTVWVCRDEPAATPELVDLGLSVKWASFNLGAIAPEGYGDYYAWGEICGYNEGKSEFNWASYGWYYTGTSKLLKYNTNSSNGTVDGKSILVAEDDVAHEKLGGSWRMPTKAEFDELSSNCTWSSTTENGVRGYRVTSKKEGFTDKSIFLPSAGYRDGTSIANASSYGYFWTSTLYSDNTYSAWRFYVSSTSSHSSSSYNRYMGCSVRPVVGIPLTSLTLEATATVSKGYSSTLTPTCTPRQPAELIWTSSNTSVATVSNGTVRGVELGTATITVSTVDGSRKASCQVSVVQPVTQVSMVYSQTGVPVGASRQLAVKVSPETAYDKSVTWTSSSPSVATVDATGKVTGVARGTTTIRAEARDGSSRYATCSVSVYDNGTVQVPTAVDLGLSVKWASFNLGATSPENYGDFYAWGETFGYKDGKTSFSWSNYTWCNGGTNSLTKYNAKTSYGVVDDKTVLEVEDDVARFKLGGQWRLPTEAEFAELRNINNCSWTWTTKNEVKGYLVTSKKNGNSIFLPVGGYRNSTSWYNSTYEGDYWTSSLAADYPYNAYYVKLSSSGIELIIFERYNGLAIRPVTK